MSFMYEFPHSKTFDSDLREILEMYFTVKSLPEKWVAFERLVSGEVTDLKNFVNNYFNNLNVQTEINNKLDAMTKDGSLSALIQPLFNAYKADINILKNRMDTFTALGEGSTTGDAELIDGRTDYKATTHTNIGAHIRDVSSQLSSEIEDKTSSIIQYNVFDYTQSVPNKSLQSAIGKVPSSSYIDSEGNSVYTNVDMIASHAYKFFVNDGSGNLVTSNTGLAVTEFSNGLSTKRTWLSPYDTIIIDNNTDMVYVSRLTEGAENLLICEVGYDIQRFYPYGNTAFEDYYERISSNSDEIAKIQEIRHSKFNCRLIESMGTKVTFENLQVEANGKIYDSKNVRFADTSKMVIAKNNGSCIATLTLDKPITNFESLTLVFYQPYETFNVNSESGAYLSVALNANDSNKRTWLNGRSIWGWTIVKLTKDMFAYYKDASNVTVEKIFFNWNKRTNVAEGAEYGTFVFDSIFFNQRIKPTFILNFDQWWNESINNGGYDYLFDNNVPFTMMTKNYDSLPDNFKALTHKAESYGCENSYYGCYGTTNTLLKNATDYATCEDAIADMKRDIVNEMKHDCISFGCSQMTLGPIERQALKNHGYKMIRGATTTLEYIPYYDDMCDWMPSYGISTSAISIEAVKAWIDNLVKYGCCGLAFTHGVCDDGNTVVDNSTSDAMNITDFKSMVDYLVQLRNENKIQLCTMEQFYNMCC